MPDPKLKLTTVDSGDVLLAGDITHQTVMGVLETDIFSSKTSVTVDFSAVNRSDSSGLALMTHWARQAKVSNISIHFERVPEKLIALAKMSGLDKILSISAK